MGIDLLPAPLRPRQRPAGKGLQRSLPWLCGALLIAAMVLWLNDRQRVLDAMQQSVRAQRPRSPRSRPCASNCSTPGCCAVLDPPQGRAAALGRTAQ